LIQLVKEQLVKAFVSTAIKLAVKHLGDLLFSSLPEQLMKSGK